MSTIPGQPAGCRVGGQPSSDRRRGAGCGPACGGRHAAAEGGWPPGPARRRQPGRQPGPIRCTRSRSSGQGAARATAGRL